MRTTIKGYKMWEIRLSNDSQILPSKCVWVYAARNFEKATAFAVKIAKEFQFQSVEVIPHWEPTDNQSKVINTLKAKGASWTAEIAERQWRAGLDFTWDDRNRAMRGLINAALQGNRDALKQRSEWENE